MLKSINIDLFLSGQAMAHGRKSTLTCVALYKLIEKHSQQHGYCFAKNSTLAAELDKKTSTVKQYLWLMKESGWINVDYHMEGNSLVRDAIRPMLEIDFENATATTANGQVLTEKRSIVKAQTSKPRNKEAEIETEDLSDVIAEESTMPTHTEVDTENKANDEEKPSPVKEYRQNHDREERDKNFMRANEDQQWAYIETLRKKGDTVNANRYEEMITGGMTTEPDNIPEETEEPKEVAVSKPREATRELTTAEQCALQTKNIKADNYDRRNNIIDEDLYHKLKLEVIAESDAKKAEEGAKKQPEQPAVQQIEANTGNTNSAVATTTNSNIATNSPYGELATPMTGTRSNYDPAEKAFYDAAKSLGVTITNHNQARKWVKEVVRTRGLESAVNYFDFMRIAFPRWQYEFKPTVKTAYDLVTKAAQIEQLIQRQREEKARKIDYDNIDFYGDAK
uniref:Winged helix-turn-helix transcription repressor n=2 Tax=Viruses TaxID=10239 RepID=A0A8S5ULJ2_9VIRU|nr:MAG TPA: winged helix-turn-helix transcription repressor [Phage sp. ctOz71]DAG02906.1 MAG TPA: winged helix-turn-helix transcription repressor [Siphoviridae sp. ctsUl6]